MDEKIWDAISTAISAAMDAESDFMDRTVFEVELAIGDGPVSDNHVRDAFVGRLAELGYQVVPI